MRHSSFAAQLALPRQAGFLLVTLLSLCGCATTSRGLHQADLRQLLEADRMFAADARARHVSVAFADRYLREGKLIGPGAPIVTGPDEVRKALAGDRSEWHWQPEDAQVSGNLGVTWGHATIGFTDAKSRRRIVKSRYVTVWKRGADRRWKIWMDIGNNAPVSL